MKAIFRVKGITAVLIFCLLVLFAAYNLLTSFASMKTTFSSKSFLSENVESKISEIETVINENVPHRYDFVNFYGALQKLMNKNEENNFEVVKNEKNEMFYEYFADGPQNRDTLVSRAKKFSDTLAAQGTKYIEIMPPDKYITGYTQLPTGAPNDNNNGTADLFLKGLKTKGVAYFDIRTTLSKSGIAPADMFFKTDHHWKIRTAFWAFSQFVDYLNKTDNLSLDPTNYYRNLSNYNIINYPNSYLGSMGRKTGTIYAGSDDFELIFPKFSTYYTYECGYSSGTVTREGRFEDALLSTYGFNSSLNPMDAQADKYETYLVSVNKQGHIVNHNNPNGPKVVLVMDSYGLPFSAFLSTVCSEIWIIDPRQYKDDVEKFVESKKPDYFLQLVSLPDLTEEFFPYGK